MGCEASGANARSGADTNKLVGRTAPAFDLPAQSGGDRVSLDALRGKVVVVDFWATWCEPCRQSFPKYQALLDRFGGDLAVVGVSEDDEPDPIAGFAEETGVGFPLVWDRDKRVAHQYEPPSMPTSFLVDQNGIIRHVYQGYHPGDEKTVEADIRALLR